MRIAAVLIFIVSILFTMWSFYEYQAMNSSQLFDAEYESRRTTERFKVHFDSVLLAVNRMAGRLTAEIEQSGLIEDDLRLLVAEEGKHPFVNSILVAFEPYQFDSDVELFSLKFEGKEQQFVVIDSVLNYRDTALVEMDWYTVPSRTLDQVLVPDFNSANDELFIDYAFPFFWTNDYGMDQFIGVLNFSFSLDLKSGPEFGHSLPIGVETDFIIADESGNLIARSKDTNINNQMIFDILALANLENHHEYVQENTQGLLNYLSPDESVSSTLYFETSELLGWKIATLVTQIDLLQRNEIIKKGKENLIIAATINVLLLVFLLFNYFQSRKD